MSSNILPLNCWLMCNCISWNWYLLILFAHYFHYSQTFSLAEWPSSKGFLLTPHYNNALSISSMIFPFLPSSITLYTPFYVCILHSWNPVSHCKIILTFSFKMDQILFIYLLLHMRKKQKKDRKTQNYKHIKTVSASAIINYPYLLFCCSVAISAANQVHLFVEEEDSLATPTFEVSYL